MKTDHWEFEAALGLKGILASEGCSCIGEKSFPCIQGMKAKGIDTNRYILVHYSPCLKSGWVVRSSGENKQEKHASEIQGLFSDKGGTKRPIHIHV